MRKLGIIGLAIVAATAFGMWSASTVAQSRVGKVAVLAASAPISPHAIMVSLAVASRRNTGRILTERYRGFRATCNNSPYPLRPAHDPAPLCRSQARASPGAVRFTGRRSASLPHDDPVALNFVQTKLDRCGRLGQLDVVRLDRTQNFALGAQPKDDRANQASTIIHGGHGWPCRHDTVSRCRPNEKACPHGVCRACPCIL